MQDQQNLTIGSGVTVSVGTDCYPATLVAVKGKRIGIVMDDYKVIRGSAFDGSAEYEYYPRPDGVVSWYSQRKRGIYVKVGSQTKYGTRAYVGNRRAYRDPHI